MCYKKKNCWNLDGGMFLTVFDEYGVFGARYRRFGTKVKMLEKSDRGYYNAHEQFLLIIDDGDSEMRKILKGEFEASEWRDIEYWVDLRDMNKRRTIEDHGESWPQ